MIYSIRRAFTLAETLITLAVIGIIAAMVVPEIMKTSPDTNVILFKKAYSTIETVISNMINDESIYPSLSIDTVANVPRGFNNTAAVANGTANKFCYYLADQMDTIGTVTCPTTAVSTIPPAKSFTTTDGIDWYIYIPVLDSTTNGNANLAANQTTSSQFPLSSKYYTTKIIVDVNGSKAPNCSVDTTDTGAAGTLKLTLCPANTDPDTFAIGVRYDGKLMAGCSKDDSTTCAAPTDATAVSILQNPTKSN